MKSFLRLLIAVMTLGCASMGWAAGPWLSEIEEGISKAKQQKKDVLVEFTGLDWCPPCQMMNKEVFSKEAFLKAIQKDYILVKLDIPKPDAKLPEKTKATMEKWQVMSVPTVILLDNNGKEYHRFNAAEQPKIEAFLKHVERAKSTKFMR